MSWCLGSCRTVSVRFDVTRRASSTDVIVVLWRGGPVSHASVEPRLLDLNHWRLTNATLMGYLRELMIYKLIVGHRLNALTVCLLSFRFTFRFLRNLWYTWLLRFLRQLRRLKLDFQHINILGPLLWNWYSSCIILSLLPEIKVLLLQNFISYRISLIIQIHNWRFALYLLSHRTHFTKVISFNPFRTLSTLFFSI